MPKFFVLFADLVLPNMPQYRQFWVGEQGGLKTIVCTKRARKSNSNKKVPHLPRTIVRVKTSLYAALVSPAISPDPFKFSTPKSGSDPITSVSL